MTTKPEEAVPKPSAKASVNVAVVGLGFMGVTHLRAYLAVPTARIAAVCDAARLPVVRSSSPALSSMMTKTNSTMMAPE